MKRIVNKKSLKLFYTIIVVFSICVTILANNTVLAKQDKIFSNGNIDTDKTQWTVKFKGKIDKKSINNDTLYVIKESTNEKISCSYSFPDLSTIIVKPKSKLIADEEYSVIVTNEIKDSNKRSIKFSAKKSFNVKEAKKIKEIGTIDMVDVAQGQQPDFPKQVEVIYNDGSLGYVDVTWNSVNTSAVGVKTVTGKIENSTLKPKIKVEVKDAVYIYTTDLEYYSYLGAYKIKVKVSSEIYSVTLNGKKMNYEGDNIYSLTTILSQGSKISIKAYNINNTLIDTSERKIN
ncbi:Ig-like domain-containing protein [Clostridium sp. BSD9I1]|uniref:Ig-like domain-containing protein n=1 Tax=Clostridium sp. BSD9I1 TaxID=2003589 RepID=UPI0016470BF6|nr:Ig-like domain-containing protein [Clostridium sp. BSD9I1]